MFSITEYSYYTLEYLLNHSNEISQEGNINANSKLFILNNGIVFKMYLPKRPYLQNLNNLLLIKERKELNAIPELVLSTELVKFNHNIIGYLMPYIKGQKLFAYLSNSSITNKQKLQIFTQLSKVINQLPTDIHIGDLHANNIIIDQYHKIHLIDIDGFSLDKGEQLSVPLPLPNILEKYYNTEGKPIISKNSDIYCVFRLFLRYISQGFDLLNSEYKDDYISFLKNTNNFKKLTEELEILYSIKDNVLDNETFCSLSVDEISLNSFFLNSNFAEKNRQASSILRNFWEEHNGKILRM